jgi:hypothetical protein
MERKPQALKPLTPRSYSEPIDLSKYMPFLRGRQYQKPQEKTK